MAREMTPQERAEDVYYGLQVMNAPEHNLRAADNERDVQAIVTLITETRRAALLEAVQMIEDDCYGGVDYFSDADTTLSFTDQMKRAHNKNQAKLAEQVRKLAQEGCGWTL